MQKQILIIIYFLFITYFSAYSQLNKIMKFQNFTTNDGLPDNYCEELIQDSYGFIWIGTDNGLCRYDGYNFKTFKNNPDDSTSVSSNFILSIFEDSKAQLWIGTNLAGVSIYNRQYNNFKQLYFKVNDSINNQRNIINQFVELNQNIWIASMYGLGKYNLQTNKISWYLVPENNENKISANRIMCLLPDGNNLWVGTNNTGFFYFNTKTEQFEKNYKHSNKDVNSLQSNKINKFYRAADNEIWIGTQESGINIFNPKTKTFKILSHNPLNPQSIGSNNVVSICKNKSELWIGTVNGGLNIYNTETNKFQQFSNNSNNPFNVNALSIKSITKDNYNNLWLTTHGRGVIFVSPIRNRFKHLNISKTEPNNYQSNYVSCFFEDEDKNIWIGTDGGGMFLYDKENTNFKVFNKLNGLSSLSILKIISANKNQLWIATWDGGLNLFDKQRKQVIKTYKNNKMKNSLGCNDVKDIYLDSNLNKLYIASHGDGLNILNIKADTFITWRNNIDYKFNLNVPELGNQILKDHKGRFWIATLYGLHLLDGNILKSFIKQADDTSSLNGYITSCLFEDSGSRIWIGTESGLSLYNEESGSFTNYDKKDGIPTKVKAIEEDKQGNLWISSNSGITKFNYNTFEVNNYDKNDGLQGNQFFERSSLKLSTGEMLFGGLNGFNLFDPDNIVEEPLQVQPYIIDFQVFNKSQLPNTPGSVLSKDITLTTEIVIKYKQSIISFEYVGLSYGFQHKNKYSVFLDGFDKEWRMMGAERKATYTNLDPGTYTFNVKVIGVDEKFDSPVKSVKLIVLPPWYKSWWFKFLVIVLVVFVLWTIYNNRIRQINKINKLLEEEVKVQTNNLLNANANLKEHQKEIILKNEELKNRNEELNALNRTKDIMFSIIAHDLKNPINSIMGFSELLLMKHKKLNVIRIAEFANYIYESSSKLAELLSNLLAWARSQTGTIKYNPRYNSISELIQKNIDLVATMLINKEIKIEVECDANIQIFLDINMVNTILRNLLVNAIKFTPKQGIINIKVQEKEMEYIVSVSDSGVGISKENIEKIFDDTTIFTTYGTNAEKGSGLGLILCKDFVAYHNGNFNIESLCGKGSVFSFSLPKV